jgi:predicted nucleic acid-binding protein
MILVDTSVWIDHLRSGDDGLATLLNNSQVLMHPFVVGELACGNLRQRADVLSLLKHLPQAAVASDKEVLFYIEQHGLMGRGIGYVDAHLMAAVAVDDRALLWTRDKRLQALAAEQGFAYECD